MKKFLILFFVLIISGKVQAVEFPTDRPAKVGHRGARALCDENTLESLKLAVDLGVDLLEFDIQRTKDGVFVLMHDVTVDRTTDGSGRVDEMGLEKFKKLKTTQGYIPPTLEETLDWLETVEVGFILDFKITDPGQAKDLIDQVEKHGLLERAIFESPDPKVAGMIEDIRPEIITSTYPVKMFLMSYYINKYDIDIPSYYHPFANPIEVAYMKSKNKDVLVWTVNKKFWIKWYTKLGVAGIMTDDPNLFKE
jgi:glycerophosphoryl diester phosphodiesterase